MDLSYQEKSILGSVLALVVVFGYYFASSVSRPGPGRSSRGNGGPALVAVIAIVVIEIVYHIVLALESKPEPKDERDVLIEGKAYRNAYFLLGGGTFLGIVGSSMAAYADAAPAYRSNDFLIVNLVLLIMVVADLMKFLTQLFYYRRGLR